MLPNFEKVEANYNHSFHINHMKVDHRLSFNLCLLLLFQEKGK